MSVELIAALALVQGVTEFIPVSSSGHLVLGHALLAGDAAAQTPTAVIIDVALHLGTLLAVMVYFRTDVARLLNGLWGLARRQNDEAAVAARHMIWATLPVLLAAGLLLLSGVLEVLRQPMVVAWASIVFAVPLYLADRYGKSNVTLTDMGDRHAVLLGLAQILALVPGASRAGVTITAGRALGFSREAAARYSMLMAMPVIVCFALLGLAELISKGDWQALGLAAIGAALAALFAFISIDVFLRLTRRFSLLPFVLYRLALGGAILAVMA